jgi:hypothetical protein
VFGNYYKNVNVTLICLIVCFCCVKTNMFVRFNAPYPTFRFYCHLPTTRQTNGPQAHFYIDLGRLVLECVIVGGAADVC